MKLVYCAQPGRLSEKREEVMEFIVESGNAPLHPFQAFPHELFEDGDVGREKTMEFCRKLIDISDEFWLFGISEGTLEDLVYALKKDKPIILHLEFDSKWKIHYERLGPKYGHPLKKITTI